MKKPKINFKEVKHPQMLLIIVLAILLIILIILNIFNMVDKQYTLTLQKNYIQNEFLDYSLIDILQEDDVNNAKASFAYKYAQNDLNSSAITEDVYKYYYKLLFNEEPDSTSIVNVQSSIQMDNIQATEVNDETDTTNGNGEEIVTPGRTMESPSAESVSYEYRCFLTDLKEDSHNQYVAVADIVTPKNDPMVTTPFSDMATGVYSTDDYVLATATAENYTEYTDVIGKVTLNLEKVEDRFVITSWDITLDD